MHNKVAQTLARTLSELGAHTVRFNFRGVGGSDGRFDHGDGETADLLAVVAWTRARYPGLPLWLAGFSFGAYVALRGAAQCEPARLAAVAPPVNLYDFATVTAPACPWCLVQGKADEIVPADQVAAWAEGLAGPPHRVWFEDVGHFFHGKLNDLRARLQAVWPALGRCTPPATA